MRDMGVTGVQTCALPIPDPMVDIVPVDHVVSAIVAVLASPPPVGEPAYFHVSSGDRNPLTFNVLYDSVRGYFEEHPFIAGERGAARLPDWRFPGAERSEEGRGGEEGRTWGSAYHLKKKKTK